MCRKSRETLLDALLIADICIDVLKNADFRICFYRKIAARLCHQCEKSECFHRNRLAAGVWSRNEQHAILLADLNIDGNDFLSIDERMARTEKLCPPIFIKMRKRCSHRIRQSCLGKGKIDRGEDGKILT